MYDVDAFGNPTDWGAAAADAAERIGAHRFNQHTGAMEWWKPGTAVIFGNRDDSRLQAELVRQLLADLDVQELGFGFEVINGLTWAMIVDSDDVDGLKLIAVEALRIEQDAKPGDKYWELYKRAQGLAGPEDIELPDDAD